jgi:hypothetical protein
MHSVTPSQVSRVWRIRQCHAACCIHNLLTIRHVALLFQEQIRHRTQAIQISVLDDIEFKIAPVYFQRLANLGLYVESCHLDVDAVEK